MKLNQKLILIIGMDEAGKTIALKNFEDMGYFCVDNLPIELIDSLIKTLQNNSDIKHAAVVIKLHREVQFKQLSQKLNVIVDHNQAKVMFMDASDQQLIARFKEHRRSQPWSPNQRVIDGIKKERALNQDLKRRATIQVNTTNLTPRALKHKLVTNFLPDHDRHFHIDVMSFGFKYGIPLDADIVMDVRFLPNPFYVPSLKHQNGNDASVYHYVMDKPVTQEFCRRLISLLRYSIPGYIKEGKPSLTIAIGCTGGQHRSVAVARKVAEVLGRDYHVNLTHRDVMKSYQKNN